LQIDNAIESITRIANTTTFAGRKLLNGELDYVTSGVVATELSTVNILGAKFGTQTSVGVTVKMGQSAQKAELTFAQSAVSGGAVTLDIRGNDGVVSLTFPASASTVDMVTQINAQVDATGVIAALSGTSGVQGMRLQSLDYGGDSFVSVKKLSTTGTFAVTDRSGVTNERTTGRDAVATVNGISATADGLKLTFSSTLLKLDLTLAETFGNGSTTTDTAAFAITGGGALFQLGPQVSTNLQENIGVKSMQSNKLGDNLVGYLADLKSGQNKALKTKQFQQASKVVQEVITQVAVLRGRLGAFERNTLQPNIRQLQITSENLTSAESTIRDTDFATETSELTRSQILVQAGNSILAIANAQSQNVLTLLGG
jgi:flagellin